VRVALEGAEQRVVNHTRNPRFDERQRGAADLLTLVIGALVLGVLVFGLMVAWYLPSADGAVDSYTRCVNDGGRYYEQVNKGKVTRSWCATNGRAINLQPAVPDYVVGARNPVIYYEYLRGPSRWVYFELADGSQWMSTKCRNDEVTGRPHQGCFWDAHLRGNHRGRSFAIVEGVKHWVIESAQPKVQS
jgi:hypothetical protein